MQTATLSAIYVSSLLDIIAANGWARAEQLSALGLTDVQLADPSRRLALDFVNDHFMRAAEVLNCPHLGLLIGHQFRVATYVETGSILGLCDSLAHAAQINTRYKSLVETAGNGDFAREDGRAFLRWEPNFTDNEAYRMITEVIFSGYVTTVRWLAWVYQKNIKALSFRHKRPDYAERYTEILQCDIAYAQPHNHLEFFAETVDAPLPMRNPARLAQIASKLDRILLGMVEESRLARRVKAAIRTLLASGGSVNIINVAAELGIGERTLRRRLRAEGESFRKLTDDVRKTLFEVFLARGESLTAISQALGYHDQSAFIKAFHRWHGMSPSQYKSQKMDF